MGSKTTTPPRHLAQPSRAIAPLATLLAGGLAGWMTSPALAHLNLGDPASIKPLPDPPFLRLILLESPTPLIGICLVAAVVTFMVLNNRAKGRAAVLAAMGLILLAAGFYSLAAGITTDRERVIESTKRLIGHTARVELDELSPLLAPDVRLETSIRSNDIPLGKGRTWLLDSVRSTLGGRYAVTDPAVLELQAVLDGPSVARSQVRVRVTPQGSGLPILSWWRLDWRKRDDQSWEATVIEPLAIGWQN